jgi:hypothetical protein
MFWPTYQVALQIHKKEYILCGGLLLKYIPFYVFVWTPYDTANPNGCMV